MSYFSDSNSKVTSEDNVSIVDEKETVDEYDESMNDCDHGRFYLDWAYCNYKSQEINKNMRGRLDRCQSDCIRAMNTLGYPYEIIMPDRIYALRPIECTCGAEDGSLDEALDSICKCPRPLSALEVGKPIKNGPFTAIEIFIDCETYEGIKKAYELLGVRLDNLSADDDDISIFCLRKAYYEQFV